MAENNTGNENARLNLNAGNSSDEYADLQKKYDELLEKYELLKQDMIKKNLFCEYNCFN